MTPAASGDDRERQGDDSAVSAVGTSPQLFLARTALAVTSGARVDGAAIAVMSTGGARELVFVSNALAQYLDDIQFTAGVGPCLDAFNSGTPVLCPDLKLEQYHEKWLGFTEDAMAIGATGVFAFPLNGGSTVFGSLELYRESASDLSTDEHAAAVRGADTIARLLLADYAVIDGSPPGREDDGRIWNSDLSRPQVNHAAGVVSVQLNISIDDAMATMRSRAYSDHRTLSDVADDVVARRLVFRPTGTSADSGNDSADNDENGA
ncbi:ANTAR domain-containing protein [Rhodococcus sovatensis]|uniref:ANTAR domain-containing protein n=1 Tax=Rhodococcus sovatensis TaxID=1805840 RepID=A0ABZ2PJM3_9NOCA